MTLDAKRILNMNGLLDITVVPDTIHVFNINDISKIRPITFHEDKD